MTASAACGRRCHRISRYVVSVSSIAGRRDSRSTSARSEKNPEIGECTISNRAGITYGRNPDIHSCDIAFPRMSIPEITMALF